MSQSTPQRCKIEISVSGPSREYQSRGSAVTFVPLTIKRRHTRKLLIAPLGQEDAKVRSSFDLPMIRTIGKAFYWQKLLDSGEVANATELARQLKLEPGWVAEVLRLTRLAPDIVQAILDGRQPRHLNLHAIRGRQADVPVDWDEQRRLLGFCTCI
ncbi:hypothetical protein FERRO_00840 [Ferrovum sp. JA12]|uniref:hypothetical protein n=1 Tax=Ferrovum sp. JA12 TaxID=1356299 RepID=UPI000702756B|nr:hypothetical protein [Ferrovum sp. JA12]KRH79023.1 hypothetical protein FERRO_00840 [Ferrovum sp. JA12]